MLGASLVFTDSGLQRAIIAEKLIEYMSFKSHYETVGPKEDIPLHEYMERLPREIVLEL